MKAMSMIVKECDVDVYASPHYWAGNPNVILLQGGEILIGFRRSGFPLRGDSDPTLRPFAIKVDCLASIPTVEPAMILDEENSLTPAFFQREDGLILTFFNRYAAHLPENRDELEAAGRRIMAERDGLVFTREPITVMASRDGARWERFGEIDIPGYAHPPAFRGNMIYASDGSILFSVYTTSDPAPGASMMSLLIRSRDGGRNWEFVSVIARHDRPDIGFGETTLYRTDRGRLIAFLRANGSDQSIHTAISEDDGLTWKPFRRHNVYGYPQDVLRLSSGGVWLTYGVRREHPGIRGKLLDGECGDIDAAAEVRICDSATGACGYPMSIQLEDGAIFTVYYVTPARDKPARISASILRETTNGSRDGN